jgi:hypothetical protein
MPYYVAWSSIRSCHDDPPRFAIHVRRIAKTATTKSYPSGDACQAGCTARSGIGPVQQIAVTSRGSIAWSAWDVSQSTVHRVFEIWAIIQGRPQRLARGDDVNPTSVRWNGGHVVWTQAGRSQSN